jgi:hypothetical protein
MNNEQERMLRKTDTAWFQVLSQHLAEGTEKNNEMLHENSRTPGRDSERALPAEPTCSVTYLLNDARMQQQVRHVLLNSHTSLCYRLLQPKYCYY